MSGDVSEMSFEALLACESDDQTEVFTPAHVKGSENRQNHVILPKQSSEVDRRTDEKLRKGKMQLDARCDLHGLNQIQAYEMLQQFIMRAVSRGCRCVLVITGKGKPRVASASVIEPERGVLKQKVPQWLAEKSLAPYILKTYSAQPKDGGSGAMYVYLRRQR